MSEGHHKFDAIAVVAYQEEHFTSPCGVSLSIYRILIDGEIRMNFLTKFLHKFLPKNH